MSTVTIPTSDATLIRNLLEAEWSEALNSARSLKEAHFALIRANVPEADRAVIVTAKLDAEARADRARPAVANLARQGIIG